MSHFYHPETGYLLHQVEYSDPKRKGQYRDATLADARKLGYLPSVTTVLSILAKPAITSWSIEQAIKATLDATILDPEATGILYALDPKTLINDLKKKSEEYRNYAADWGTACHWYLNHKLRGIKTLEIPPMVPGAEEVADALIEWFPLNGYEWEKTEHHFARPDLGYGGSVDLIGTHYGKPCIADLKTQEPPLVPWPEFPYQLAGYDYALPWMGELMAEAHQHSLPDGTIYLCESVHRERISLIANRLVPGEIKEHIWIDKDSTVEATNRRYDRIWLGLVDLWCLLHQYDPREVLSS